MGGVAHFISTRSVQCKEQDLEKKQKPVSIQTGRANFVNSGTAIRSKQISAKDEHTISCSDILPWIIPSKIFCVCTEGNDCLCSFCLGLLWGLVRELPLRYLRRKLRPSWRAAYPSESKKASWNGRACSRLVLVPLSHALTAGTPPPPPELLWLQWICSPHSKLSNLK